MVVLTTLTFTKQEWLEEAFNANERSNLLILMQTYLWNNIAQKYGFLSKGKQLNKHDLPRSTAGLIFGAFDCIARGPGFESNGSQEGNAFYGCVYILLVLVIILLVLKPFSLMALLLLQLCALFIVCSHPIEHNVCGQVCGYQNTCLAS